MKSYRTQMGGVIGAFLAALMLATGCQTGHLSETQRMERAIRHEIPFPIDSLHWLEGTGIPTFSFANSSYIPTAPDAVIATDGMLTVWNTFLPERPTRQDEGNIWRNVAVSKRRRRVVCIDRYLRQGRTRGYGYVLQSECKAYPTLGTFHWDVSDARNTESLGEILSDLRRVALLRGRLAPGGEEPPLSQEAYWRLMFHADSLYADGLYAEALQTYRLAFTDERYILPSQLSTVARKMAAIGMDSASISFLRRRMDMEQDFYEDPERCSHLELRDSFLMRSRQWNYDIELKEDLEQMLERDQYNRLLWLQAANSPTPQAERVEHLARRALETDSINLSIMARILSKQGFPSNSQVGQWGTQAVWLVFQHSDLDHQRQFLPQLEQAVERGDIAPAFLAALQDRIAVREGRPQKYGTQMGSDGRLAPLLDASRLNEWRQEVGLPPLE